MVTRQLVDQVWRQLIRGYLHVVLGGLSALFADASTVGCLVELVLILALEVVGIRLLICLDVVLGDGSADVGRDHANHLAGGGRPEDLVVEMIGDQEIDGVCVLLFNADDLPRRLLSPLGIRRDVHKDNIVDGGSRHFY